MAYFIRYFTELERDTKVVLFISTRLLSELASRSYCPYVSVIKSYSKPVDSLVVSTLRRDDIAGDPVDHRSNNSPIDISVKAKYVTTSDQLTNRGKRQRVSQQ